MIAIVSLLVVVTLSILVTRIATIALVHTGLSRQSARFQARSAFTGAGFTTHESERVVDHPVRRRIVLLLMLFGNAGIITAVSSLILTFVGDSGGDSIAWKVALLALGLGSLWAAASSRWVDRQLSTFISRALERFTELDVQDYASLMHIEGGYRLAQIEISRGHWLADQSLAESRAGDEGVVILGIRRADGTFLGAPHGRTIVAAGDTLIVYGDMEAIEGLSLRSPTREGDLEHREAVLAHRSNLESERERDPVLAGSG